MSTINVHWFHPIGFRPGVVVERKDFAGDYGVHEYVIVAPDADIPYSSKYEGPLDFVVPPEFIPEVPLTNSLIPRPFYDRTDSPPQFYSSCCGSSYNPPVDHPPPAAVPLPASGLMMLVVVALLLRKAWLR